jgi:predicted DNA-binding WGR domain protein
MAKAAVKATTGRKKSATSAKAAPTKAKIAAKQPKGGKAKAPATKSSKKLAVKTTAVKKPAKSKGKAASKTITKAAKPANASKAVATASDDDDLDFGELDVVLKTLVGKNASVITDDDGAVYDVKLAKIDLSKNEDKYYIIQAVKDGKKHFCFTRWGRTGTKGQTELKAGDGAIVMDTFAKKFKDKTGCSWSDRENFVQKSGFYDLLKIDYLAARARSTAPPAKWEYYIDDYVNGKATGWYPYDEAGTENCEDLWETYMANQSFSRRIVESGGMGFQYLVDLTKMTQRNLSSNKERNIRRVPGDDDDL